MKISVKDAKPCRRGSQKHLVPAASAGASCACYLQDYGIASFRCHARVGGGR
jgi:hypothetical protein